MISSGDVSGIFAAQQQGFATQLDYASRVGIPGGGQGMFGAPPAGGGGGFSYGPGGFTGPGFGSGNRFGGTAVSGAGLIGGAASFGSTYLGLAGMLPQGLSRMLPFGAFAGTTAGAIASAGLALPAAVIGAGVHGAQQQMAFNNNLGGFNFFNAGTRGGSGFGRQEASGLSNMVRTMSELPSMLTSMDELTNILGKLKSTGIMQGVTSATEFGHRFKEAIGTIRETAKILGTSMEDAQSFFAHSRGVGFLGRADQLRNALNVQLTSGLTGMTNGQVMQLQANGANMATSMGGRRSLGATAATTIAQNIGAAQRNGLLSDEMIQDLTGMSGADGVGAAAERMTGLMSKMATNTAGGQFMLAGMTKFVNGRATFDKDIARQFESGLISFNELRRRGMNLTDAQKISFRARQTDLATGFAGSIGPGGMSRFLGGLVEGRGEDAENLLIQMNGGNANDADFMRKMRGAGTDMEFSQMSRMRGSEASIRERTSPSAIFKRVMTKIHAGTFGPIERAGGEILTSVSKGYDDFIDDLVGRHVIALSKNGAQAFARAMSGGNKAEMNAMFSAASGVDAMNVDRSFGSKLGTFFGLGSDSRLVEKMVGGNTKDIAGRLSALSDGKASGGEGVFDILDEIKASSNNFHRMDPMDQLKFVRGEMAGKINRAMASAGIRGSFSTATSLTDAQITRIATSGGENGFQAARLIRAMQKSKGAAADPFLNMLASAEKLSTGEQMHFGELYDNDAVKASRSMEKLTAIQNKAHDALKDVGLSDGAISAMKDSPAVRKALGRVAANDQDYMRLIRQGDAGKLGLSAAELDAVREYAGEFNTARASGKNLMGALQTFDTAQAAGDIFVIAKSFKDAGAEASAGADFIKDKAGVKGYSAELANVGAALSAVSVDRNQKSLDAAQNAVKNFTARVFADKNLTPEMRAQIMHASGSTGASIAFSEKLRGLKGSFTKDQLASKLDLAGNAEGMNLLGELGFTNSSSTLLDKDKFDKLFSRGAGLAEASAVARSGQAAQAGETKDDKIIAVLQKIDTNQNVMATILAMKNGDSEAVARGRVQRLQKSYSESH